MMYERDTKKISKQEEEKERRRRNWEEKMK